MRRQQNACTASYLRKRNGSKLSVKSTESALKVNVIPFFQSLADDDLQFLAGVGCSIKLAGLAFLLIIPSIVEGFWGGVSPMAMQTVGTATFPWIIWKLTKQWVDNGKFAHREPIFITRLEIANEMYCGSATKNAKHAVTLYTQNTEEVIFFGRLVYPWKAGGRPNHWSVYLLDQKVSRWAVNFLYWLKWSLKASRLKKQQIIDIWIQPIVCALKWLFTITL